MQVKDFLVLIALLLAMMHWLALPKIHLQGIESVAGTSHMLMPANIQIKNQDSGAHTYTLTIDYHALQQTLFQIHPQNCLKQVTLNGFPVSYPPDERCNFNEGVRLNLKHSLIQGENTLVIETAGGGLSIGPVIFGSSATLSELLGCLLAAMACLTLARIVYGLTGDTASGIILAGSMLLCFYVLSHTTFMWNKYDMPQHLEYITFIANELRLPNTYQGFLTYHPPLYYTVQAVVLRIANLLASFDIISTLRVFNILYFTTSLVFSMLALHRLLIHPFAYYAALVMLAFYPGGIIASGRIDSDLLFYPFFSACLYFLLRWLDSRHYRYLAFALGACGLALATRTNALVLFPLFGLAGLYYIKRNGWRLLWSQRLHMMVWVGVVIVMMGALINFGRPAYDNLRENRNQSYLVANAGYLASIARSLHINNDWDAYFGFDLKEYITPPFFNVWGNAGGRQYFWSSVMKSSMYGEFTYPEPWIARNMNRLLLGMVFFIFASILMNMKRLGTQPEWLIFGMALLIPISGLAANRILHPIACSQDFRYIYPAIAAFCGLVGFSVEMHLARGRHAMALIGVAAMLAFTGFSLLFFTKLF